MSISSVPIGLQGYIQTINLNSTPQNLYSGKVVPGRYMMVFIQYGVNLLGGIDFVLDGTNLHLVSFYNFTGVTKCATPFSLGLSDGTDVIYLDFQYPNIVVNCENSMPFVTAKTFLISMGYSGVNNYSVDHISENTTGNGIIFDNAIETPIVTSGIITVIDADNDWNFTNFTARRIGKNIYIAGNATVTSGISGITSNTPINFLSITPTDKFINTHPVTGICIFKNGSTYTNGIVTNNPDSEIAKLQLLYPEPLTSGQSRNVSFSISYIIE